MYKRTPLACAIIGSSVLVAACCKLTGFVVLLLLHNTHYSPSRPNSWGSGTRNGGRCWGTAKEPGSVGNKVVTVAVTTHLHCWARYQFPLHAWYNLLELECAGLVLASILEHGILQGCTNGGTSVIGNRLNLLLLLLAGLKPKLGWSHRLLGFCTGV